MKILRILSVLLFPVFLTVSCSSDVHSNALREYLNSAQSSELVIADMVWDGGSMYYAIAYKGDFDGEKYLYVFCPPFDNPNNAEIYVSSEDNASSRDSKYMIKTNEEKEILLDIITKFSEYNATDVVIYALSGKRPIRESGETYKVPPRMMDMFLNKLKEQK